MDFINSHRFIILDGGMGTELQRRGYKTKLPFWSSSANLDSYGLVKSIHEDYVEVGVDIITTNTFRTQKYIFEKTGKSMELAKKATELAVKVAIQVKNEVDREVFVGGSLSPLEDCYSPDDVPDNSILRDDHFYQAN